MARVEYESRKERRRWIIKKDVRPYSDNSDRNNIGLTMYEILPDGKEEFCYNSGAMTGEEFAVNIGINRAIADVEVRPNGDIVLTEAVVEVKIVTK